MSSLKNEDWGDVKGGHPILFLAREKVRKNKTLKNNAF
jgi:hypothetical protein